MHCCCSLASTRYRALCLWRNASCRRRAVYWMRWPPPSTACGTRSSKRPWLRAASILCTAAGSCNTLLSIASACLPCNCTTAVLACWPAPLMNHPMHRTADAGSAPVRWTGSKRRPPAALPPAPVSHACVAPCFVCPCCPCCRTQLVAAPARTWAADAADLLSLSGFSNKQCLCPFAVSDVDQELEDLDRDKVVAESQREELQRRHNRLR